MTLHVFFFHLCCVSVKQVSAHSCGNWNCDPHFKLVCLSSSHQDSDISRSFHCFRQILMQKLMFNSRCWIIRWWVSITKFVLFSLQGQMCNKNTHMHALLYPPLQCLWVFCLAQLIFGCAASGHSVVCQVINNISDIHLRQSTSLLCMPIQYMLIDAQTWSYSQHKEHGRSLKYHCQPCCL